MPAFLSKINHIFSQLRTKRFQKYALFLFALIVVGSVFVLVHGVNAQTNVATFVEDSFWFRLISRILLSISGLFLKMTLFILSFMIELAGYNGYIDSPAVTVGWVMVRDMTNMAFVVILLLIAFGTILGIEQYEWKKLLVKFVFAAILVNFSRTVCGILIDIGQVLMTTFVNGIAATAGGNLITAFNLDKIMNLSGNANPANIGDSGFLIASIAAVFFTAIVMCVMGAFLWLLLARMVVLWVLIILSPLAFVLSVLPQTESYASEWWHELSANIITGPVLLFFVWLSFVTLGAGNIHSDIAGNTSVPNKIEGPIEADKVGNVQFGKESQSAGISEAMGWAQMANFFIAIAMLLVGAKTAQKLGGAGADAIGKGVEYGKSIGHTLTTRPAKAAGKGMLKGAAYVAPALVGAGLGGVYAKRFFERQVESFHAWRKDTGYGPKVKMVQKTKDKLVDGKKVVIGKNKDGTDKYEQELDLDKKGNVQMVAAKDDKDRVIYETDDHGNYIYEQRELGLVQGLFANQARRNVSSLKKLEKTKKFADNREELLKTRTQGIPSGLFMKEWESADALDRIEEGQLAGEKLRSAAKTKKYHALGESLVAHNNRMQLIDGEVVVGDKSMEQLIVDFEMDADKAHLNGEAFKNQIKLGYLNSAKGKGVVEAQAGNDAMANAVTRNRQQQLADVRDVRASDALALVERAVEAQLKEYRTQLENKFKSMGDDLEDSDVQKKIDDQVKVDKIGLIKDAIKGISESNAEIASAYSASLEKLSVILQNKSQGLLEDEIEQMVIGEEHGISFPTNAARKAIEAVIGQFGKMEKEQMLGAIETMMASMAKKHQDAKDKKRDYDEKEQRVDSLYLHGMMAALQKERYIDDETGNPEANIALQAKLDNLTSKLEDSVGKDLADSAREALKKGLEDGIELGKDNKKSVTQQEASDLERLLMHSDEKSAAFQGALQNLAQKMGNFGNFKDLAEHVASSAYNEEDTIKKLSQMNRTTELGNYSEKQMVRLLKAMAQKIKGRDGGAFGNHLSTIPIPKK